MKPRETIEAFDAWLASDSLTIDAIVVGGAALALLGVTSRQTRDVDVLDPLLSERALDAARRFATLVRTQGTHLDDTWLNNGPAQLTTVLPEGWRDRLRTAFRGERLALRTLGRSDLLKTKLFALCDRGTDLSDCIALKPSMAELDAAEPWFAYQDANPMWPEHVSTTFEDLKRRLGHVV